MTIPEYPCCSCPKADDHRRAFGKWMSSCNHGYCVLILMHEACNSNPKNQVFLSLNEFLKEAVCAQAKHPNWPASDPVEAVSIMLCEAGEALKEARKFRETGNREHVAAMRKEIVQTGAMALRLLVESDFFNDESGQ